MAYKHHTTLDYQPYNLSDAEKLSPQKVILEFYDTYAMPSWDTLLTEWIKSAFSNTIWQLGSPSALLRFYGEVIRAVEAAWLIGTSENGHTGTFARACRELFQQIDLAQFRDDLWDLLNAGLSPYSVKEIADYKSGTQTFIFLFTFLYLLAPVGKEGISLSFEPLGKELH